MKIHNGLKFFVSLAVPVLAGAVGSVFTVSSVSGWYSTLVRPDFSPPNWIFGPVWTALYLLMGVAVFLIWRRGLCERGVKKALGLFIGQLVLNVLWSVIFFGLHSPGGALLEIIFLWAAILATIFAFSRISRPAAWLLVPYILWVSFAAYLNYTIFILN